MTHNPKLDPNVVVAVWVGEFPPDRGQAAASVCGAKSLVLVAAPDLDLRVAKCLCTAGFPS